MAIKNFKVYAMPNKVLIASDAGMKNLKARGVITDKGEVRFTEDLFLVKTKEGETILVANKVDNKNGKLVTSSSVEMDGEKVELKASFDPRTGEMTADFVTTKVKKAKKVTLKKDDSKIDILPKRLMDLFLLPQNKVAFGQKIEFTAPMMKVELTATEAKIADDVKLSSSFNTDKTNKIEGMDKEMMDAYPTMTANVDAVFNTNEGVLKSITADISTKISMAGMNIDITSDIKMEQVK